MLLRNNGYICSLLLVMMIMMINPTIVNSAQVCSECSLCSNCFVVYHTVSLRSGGGHEVRTLVTDQHCTEPWAGWWLVGNLIRVIVELSTQHDYKIPHMDHSQFLLFSPSPLNSYLLRKVVLCKGITVTSRVLCSLGWNMFCLFVYPHKCFLQLGLHTFKFATNLCEIMLKMVWWWICESLTGTRCSVQARGGSVSGVMCEVWRGVAICRHHPHSVPTQWAQWASVVCRPPRG